LKKREIMKEDTRKKIIEAIEILKVLDEKITVSKIAKEANLSRQTVLRYLKKDEKLSKIVV